MAKEDLDTLGFSKDIVVMPGPELETKSGEIIAGLSSAKKGKGGIFGLPLPGSGYVAPKPAGGLGGHGGIRGGT
jgi:hypothetical protein